MDARPIVLDYVSAASTKLLTNLSGIAEGSGLLWTVADEGRTVECLAPHGDGYRLRRQFSLDALFPGLPGRKDAAEADLESVDVAGGRLWLCGSHCRVRRKAKRPGMLNAALRKRPSRHLLGSVKLATDGSDLDAAGEALPFRGPASLRRHLSRNPLLSPFLEIPSKENGLDIEGMVASGDHVLLGLRGPLIDSTAVVVPLRIRTGLTLARQQDGVHLLDLDGLGIRDLARWERDVMILAGPVSGADRPFRLYHWRPRWTARVQRPQQVLEWPPNIEHPEGICRLDRHGQIGLIVLYDSPDAATRIDGNAYVADWLPLSDPA